VTPNTYEAVASLADGAMMLGGWLVAGGLCGLCLWPAGAVWLLGAGGVLFLGGAVGSACLDMGDDGEGAGHDD
jgi:hypothetical protein